MKNTIILTKTEIQSGSNRVNWAEGLILQLPDNHDGRNSWLLNYGIREEAQKLRTEDRQKYIDAGFVPRTLEWDDETDSLHVSR